MTVGELRKLLEGVPDDMDVEATYDSGFGHADGVSAQVRENGDGKPVLFIDVDS